MSSTSDHIKLIKHRLNRAPEEVNNSSQKRAKVHRVSEADMIREERAWNIALREMAIRNGK
jgi:hypothetical protein